MTNKKGFTLIEIMIVVAIIGILGATFIPNYLSVRETARQNVCLANIREMQQALDIAALIGNATITDLGNDAAIQAVILPNYIKSMPNCSTGTYSTDSNGVVHCSVHLAAAGGPPPASPF